MHAVLNQLRRANSSTMGDMDESGYQICSTLWVREDIVQDRFKSRLNRLLETLRLDALDL
ncbi:MAG: hypothetical protein K0S73_1381 [Stenotrophomonas rhizophila]|nr:hypothetical protein [Stenotrophomonas rhizophila]